MTVFFELNRLLGPYGQSIYYSNSLLRNLCEVGALSAGPAQPMNVVSIRSLHAGGRSLRAADLRIARVEIFDDMAAVEPHWRSLEAATVSPRPTNIMTSTSNGSVMSGRIRV